MKTYDLIWQSKTPGEPFDAALVSSALEARGATARPDGAWVLAVGKVEVVCAPVREAGAVIGVDVRVPLLDRPETLASVVQLAAAISAQVGYRLIDPNLGREVRVEDVSAIEAAYMRMATYAGQYGGVSEAVGAAWATEPSARTDTSSTTFLLAAVAFVVAAYLAYTVVS